MLANLSVPSTALPLLPVCHSANSLKALHLATAYLFTTRLPEQPKANDHCQKLEHRQTNVQAALPCQAAKSVCRHPRGEYRRHLQAELHLDTAARQLPGGPAGQAGPAGLQTACKSARSPVPLQQAQALSMLRSVSPACHKHPKGPGSSRGHAKAVYPALAL